MFKLNAARIKTITKTGLHGDGRGLYLRVAPGGSKGWIQRITIDGRRRDIGLGGYPTVSLAKVRLLADANRSAVAEGRDPLAEKRKARTPAFREAALRVHEANLPRWRNGKHTTGWLQSLERHAFPVIGNIPVDRIDRSDVLRVLAPIWGSKPETARRVRQRIRAILRWCLAHGLVEHNVAGDMIDGALPPMPKVKAHFSCPALSGSAGSLGSRGSVQGVPRGKGVLSVLGLDRCAFGGGSGCNVERNRYRAAGMAYF